MYHYVRPARGAQPASFALNIYKYLKLKGTTKMRDISLGGINNQNIKKLNMIKPFGFAGISYFE